MAKSGKLRKGQCLCGAVSITAHRASNTVGACHCGSCRKWASAPFMEIECGTDVDIDGEAHVTVYQSSEWAERGFCSKCGTNLFYRLKETQQHMVSVALFDIDDELEFTQQVFIDEKPAFYTFANDTKNMTGPELFALYAPPAE